MEQKKLMLVLVSVGVFLVVVLGAGILVFKPRPKPQTAMTTVTAPAPNAPASAPASADPAEWVRNPKAVPGLQAAPAGSANSRGDVIIIYGERPNGTGQAAPNGQTPSPNTAVKSDGSLKVDVAVPQTQNQAVPPAPPRPAARVQRYRGEIRHEGFCRENGSCRESAERSESRH